MSIILDVDDYTGAVEKEIHNYEDLQKPISTTDEYEIRNNKVLHQNLSVVRYYRR